MTTTFVLVHGSWHGGWAWRSVIRELEARGHRAYAPTLAGHGPDVDRTGITHADCVASVVSHFWEHDLRDVVLVGHSFGGSIISRVVAYVPGRIKRLVFLNAFVLDNGQSIYDNLPGSLIELLDQLASASPDNTTLLPLDIWCSRFIQDAPDEVARALWQQLSPEPNQPNVEKLDLRALYAFPIPKSYIVCRDDQTLPPGSFHSGMSSRLGTYKLVEMDGSHEVMFTRPAELAEKLIEASPE